MIYYSNKASLVITLASFACYFLDDELALAVLCTNQPAFHVLRLWFLISRLGGKASRGNWGQLIKTLLINLLALAVVHG